MSAREIRHIAKLSGAVPAWWGTRGDLQRLANVTESLVAERRDRAFVEFREEFAATYNVDPNDLADAEDHVGQMYREREEDFTEEWATEVSVTDSEGFITAGPPVLLSEIDVRAVRAVEIRSPSRNYSPIGIKISMPASYPDKIHYEVSSDDRGWTTKARVLLETELKRGVPRDAMLRHPVVAGFLGLTAAAVFWMAMFLLVHDPGEPASAFAYWALLTGAVAAFFAMPTSSAVVPSFRLVDTGTGVDRARHVIFLISLALTLLIEVIVGLVTNKFAG